MTRPQTTTQYGTPLSMPYEATGKDGRTSVAVGRGISGAAGAGSLEGTQGQRLRSSPVAEGKENAGPLAAAERPPWAKEPGTSPRPASSSGGRRGADNAAAAGAGAEAEAADELRQLAEAEQTAPDDLLQLLAAAEAEIWYLRNLVDTYRAYEGGAEQLRARIIAESEMLDRARAQTAGLLNWRRAPGLAAAAAEAEAAEPPSLQEAAALAALGAAGTEPQSLSQRLSGALLLEKSRLLAEAQAEIAALRAQPAAEGDRADSAEAEAERQRSEWEAAAAAATKEISRLQAALANAEQRTAEEAEALAAAPRRRSSLQPLPIGSERVTAEEYENLTNVMAELLDQV